MAGEFRRIRLVEDTNGADYTGDSLYIQKGLNQFVRQGRKGNYPECAKIYIASNTFRVRYADLEKLIGSSLISNNRARPVNK